MMWNVIREIFETSPMLLGAIIGLLAIGVYELYRAVVAR